LVREVFEMMEVQMKKIWICPAKNANGGISGYFSSIVAEIKDYVQNFITCPVVQVYWWLQRRGCLLEDINKLIRYCFTLKQQKRVTRLKYLLTKGYAILTEEDSDDIINAVSSKGIYDMTLGLPDKERREQVTNQAYNVNAIMFGEAKEGAMEAYKFLANASITTIHSTNKTYGKLVTPTKTLAQSIFSVETGTSKVTDGDNKEDDSYNKAGKVD
jgi:hypothetical protein